MTGLPWLLPFLLQGAAMAVDEFGFHPRREVPTVEWLGHLLDTGVVLACLALPLLLAPTPASLRGYGILATVSCVLVTKDEFIHQRLCGGAEHWLHALLFLLHPLVLIATACLWARAGGAGLAEWPGPPPGQARTLLQAQVLAVGGFLALQALRGALRLRAAAPPGIDNRIYDQLGERWYGACDDPVALLRAEGRLRTGWVLAELDRKAGGAALDILDVACGGGFLANPAAAAGHRVTGIDLSMDSLATARRHDASGSAAYLAMDARELAFADGSFDVVCMMDFLEHVEERDAVIREASRVLRPGGWLFFHTFNRTPIAGLIAIKGVEWFVRNTPPHMHVYHLFLRPSELRQLCARHGLAVDLVRGLRPRICTPAFLRLLLTGIVSDGFQFTFTRSQSIGYCGRATRIGPPPPGSLAAAASAGPASPARTAPGGPGAGRCRP